MHVEVSHPPNYAPWQLAAGHVPVSVPRGAGCATSLLLLVLRRSRIQTWGCFVALRESSLQKAAEEAGGQRAEPAGAAGSGGTTWVCGASVCVGHSPGASRQEPLRAADKVIISIY